jgi:diacylglycerol kinase family enzyme
LALVGSLRDVFGEKVQAPTAFSAALIECAALHAGVGFVAASCERTDNKKRRAAGSLPGGTSSVAVLQQRKKQARVQD